MRHIVSYSGGAGSFCAAQRVVAEYGADNVELLFTDTKMEDETLYTFLEASAAYLGAKLVVIAEGRDPWQVFKDRRVIGNTQMDPCSETLKRNFMMRYIKKAAKETPVTVYVGIDWTEQHRLPRVVERYAPVCKVLAPMCEPPYLTKPAMLASIRAAGLEMPRLYQLGFAHNNCGGFCVKAGMAAFKQLLQHLPERYAYHEAKEEEMRQFLGKDVAILRDRRGLKKGDKPKPLTLKALRERILDEDEQFEFGGCGCML